MALIKCPKCNNHIVEGIQECSFCGHIFWESEDKEGKRKDKQRQLLGMLIAVPIVLFVITFIVSMFRGCGGA